MTFEITKGSDLLSLKQVELLNPKQLKEYNEAAATFVASFNEGNPHGKSVTVDVKQVILNDDNVTFVIAKNANLSTQSYTFPYSVVDRMASNHGVVDAEGLHLISLQTLEPLRIDTAVKAVNAGDTYETKNGTEQYKCAAMVRVEGTREELVFSDDAKAIVADMAQKALQAKLSSGSSRRRTAVRSAIAQPVSANGVEEVEA